MVTCCAPRDKDAKEAALRLLLVRLGGAVYDLPGPNTPPKSRTSRQLSMWAACGTLDDFDRSRLFLFHFDYEVHERLTAGHQELMRNRRRDMDDVAWLQVCPCSALQRLTPKLSGTDSARIQQFASA